VRVSETALKEVILIEPEVHEDRRGCFLELYQLDRYAKAGLPSRFVQDNLAHSSRGVLRGLHYQVRHPQGKLVTVLRGRVFDVAVDIRRGSPSFGKWSAVELSGDNQQQLYVPPGFAHGYCVLSETAAVLYKCTDFYFPEDERGIVWNDPAVGIPWPIQEPLLSEKDRGYRTLAESEAELPLYAARLTERLN
jgi:dTDP-4-dehydrorhamnose 3,5-epimerase